MSCWLWVQPVSKATLTIWMPQPITGHLPDGGRLLVVWTPREKPRGAGNCWSSRLVALFPCLSHISVGHQGTTPTWVSEAYGKPQQPGSLRGFTLGNPSYHSPLAFPTATPLDPLFLLNGESTQMEGAPRPKSSVWLHQSTQSLKYTANLAIIITNI